MYHGILALEKVDTVWYFYNIDPIYIELTQVKHLSGALL